MQMVMVTKATPINQSRVCFSKNPAGLRPRLWESVETRARGKSNMSIKGQIRVVYAWIRFYGRRQVDFNEYAFYRR